MQWCGFRDVKDGWLGAASLTHETAPVFIISLSMFVEVILLCTISSTAISRI